MLLPLSTKSFSLLSALSLVAALAAGCGVDSAESVAELEPELTSRTQSLSYNGSDYMFVTSPRTWADARSYCQQQGYDLVTINDSGEEAFLETEERTRGLYNWWIGLNDQSVEGQWSWAHSSSTYTNWYPHQPDNHLGREHCALDRFRTSDGTIVSELWNDDTCDLATAFICERASALIYKPAPFYHNLVVNPNGDSGHMGGWTITSNGGNGWLAHLGADASRSHDNGFLTSFAWAKREQVIDLRAQGFSSEFLDTQPPLIVSEVFEKVFCPDDFYLAVDLLDANKNVIHTWSSGTQRHKDTACDYSGYREQIGVELRNYGRGVRFIRWRDGGKDSESWWGHFGPKLQNAYLGFAPANLLNNPGELASWTILENGGDGFLVSGPTEARRFSTSWGWAKRQQTVDLLALGYTASELDTGELPILASSSYGKVACSDQYYLKVQLLDQNHNVLDAFDSGIRTHAGPCDYTYAVHREVLMHRFNKYPAGVRYIRWEEGGRDSESWAGHFGTYMEAPYLGIVNHTVAHRLDGRLLSESSLRDYLPSISFGAGVFGIAALTCIGSFGIACGPAVAAATALTALDVGVNHMIVSKAPTHHADTPPTACDANCKLDKIKSNLDVDTLGRMWSLEYNTSIQILASPKAGDMLVQAQDMVKAVKEAVSSGEELIDITTLQNITGPRWFEELANALRAVESQAATNNTAPVVRIYLGQEGFTDEGEDGSVLFFDCFGLPIHKWNDRLRDTLGRLTAQLAGNSNMRIYIAGGRSRSRSLSSMNWNHAKIVAVDGKRSITGGHNMWEQYFGPTPVFDTSIHVAGDSSKAAHRFADELWRIHQRDFPSSDPYGTHILRWERRVVTENETGIPASTSILSPWGSGETGNIPILSVGQLGRDEYTSQVKKAVMNMVDAAEKSIYISQQSLYAIVDKQSWLYPIDEPLMRKLTEKAIGGVDVRVVISNEDAPYDTTSPVSLKKTLEAIWSTQADGTKDNFANREKFCRNFTISNLRIDDTSETYRDHSQSFANHSKAIMVDKQMFLIGSHNLYEQWPAQLNEFAYVVADAGKAQDYYHQYWEPVLTHSERTSYDSLECIDILSEMPRADPL